MTATAARRVLIPPGAPASVPDGVVSTLDGATMGTTWRVRLVADEGGAAGLHAGILAVLDRVIAQMSTWEPQSDLSRFNQAAAGTWHALAPETWRVLDAALDVAAASGGAYDPSIGHLVDLWGFGPAGPRADLPYPARVAAARVGSGWPLLEQAGTPRRRLRQPGGLSLDFSSIAKGFAVDLVAEFLARAGVASFLVEIGGELRGVGIKPDRQPWWVALEPPDDRPQEIVPTVIALHGLSVATSGDYRRRFQADGTVCHHLIDPRSGWPAVNGLAAVSVLHPSCMMADAWATALAVLGPQAGPVLAEAQGLAALFTERRTGRLVQTLSPACAAMLE